MTGAPRSLGSLGSRRSRRSLERALTGGPCVVVAVSNAADRRFHTPGAPCI